MMTEAPNPYAAPRTASDGNNNVRKDSNGEGAWRDGKFLVMRRLARLPNVCVKSGKTADILGVPRTLYWVPNWTWLTLFVGGPALTAISALFFGRRQTIDIPLCAKEHSKRRFRINVGYSLVLAAPALVTLYLTSTGFEYRQTTTYYVLVAGVFVSH